MQEEKEEEEKIEEKKEEKDEEIKEEIEDERHTFIRTMSLNLLKEIRDNLRTI